MAIPWLLPLLLTGASIGANTIGARQAEKAQANAMAAERARQRAFDEESYAINEGQRARYEDVGGQTTARSDSLADMFAETAAEAPARPVAALPQTSSNLVTASDTVESSRASADSADRARRLAGLRGFGDLLGDFDRSRMQDASKLGLVGSFRRGSQNVLPLELQAAQSKGANWMFLGDLLSAGAGLTTPGALLAKGAGAVRPRPNPFY